MQSVRMLMSGIVDYAGLFPPAKLPMDQAAANYASYLGGEHAWMLGRFVIPVARLDEFERAAVGHLPPQNDDDPWRLSAIIGEDLNADIDRIFAFNRAYAEGDEEHGAAAGAAVIDTIELKATTPDQIDRALAIIPEQLEPFFEIPLAGDPRGLVAALSGTGARAKVRTGGVTPDAFPAAAPLAGFISACHAADVPFKATAGLHHPVRAEFALTYEPNCPRGMMYGFLNVFLAAAFVRFAKASTAEATDMLNEREPRAFSFSEESVTWRDKRLDTIRLARARETFAISFGSCSFTEPVNELRELKLLA